MHSHKKIYNSSKPPKMYAGAKPTHPFFMLKKSIQQDFCHKKSYSWSVEELSFVDVCCRLTAGSLLIIACNSFFNSVVTSLK